MNILVRAGFVAFAALAVATTVTGPARAQYVSPGASPPPGVVYVPNAPPPEIVEVQPPPPDPRPFWHWQKGHWRWNGREYAWNPGHWVHRPPRVTEWIAPHWEHHPNGWFFVEGRWR